MAETNRPPSSSKKYFYGLGRRKSASARVRVFTSKGEFMVNNKEAKDYFCPPALAEQALAPIKETGLLGKVAVSARVVGGGMHAQADAIRLGVARALVLLDPEFKPTLKKTGFLTRDPRGKERKKYGLKRARRAPQWSKR